MESIKVNKILKFDEVMKKNLLAIFLFKHCIFCSNFWNILQILRKKCIYVLLILYYYIWYFMGKLTG